MRTIQVVNVRWYNATAWYGVTLAKALNDAGHPSLVAGLAGTPPLERARDMGLETAALPLNRLFALPALPGEMKRVLDDFRPDVVNCHRGESFVLWALWKQRRDFALIRTRGDRRPPRGGRVNRWLHAEAADAVIATNSGIARLFRDRLAVPPDRLHTILGGVDTGRFRPDAAARDRTRAALGLTGQDFVIGLVGRLDEVKGVRETIAAFGRAAARWEGKRPRLLLVGFASQYDREDVARWTAEAGLGLPGENVLLSGRVERPEDFINAFDLGVLASLGSEAIARAALEIMASGVPLVSSRVGVMPDLLPSEGLFEPGDVEAMAAMMRKAMPGAGDAWRAFLRKAGLARVLHPEAGIPGLTLADFRDQTLAVYQTARARRNTEKTRKRGRRI